MKIRVEVSNDVVRRLKRKAAGQGRTISEIVEGAPRLCFRPRRKQTELPPLPTFRSGSTLVDISDRDALFRAMATK